MFICVVSHDSPLSVTHSISLYTTSIWHVFLQSPISTGDHLSCLGYCEFHCNDMSVSVLDTLNTDTAGLYNDSRNPASKAQTLNTIHPSPPLNCVDWTMVRPLGQSSSLAGNTVFKVESQEAESPRIRIHYRETTPPGLAPG